MQQIKKTKDKITDGSYLWFQPNLIYNMKYLKNFFHNLICFIINHVCMLLLFQCSSYSSLEETNLIAIVN